MRTKHESTLSPFLTGTRVHAKSVTGVAGRGEARRERDVLYRNGSAENVSIPELQDHLLLAKGYLPKYSGMSLEELAASTGSNLAALKKKAAYWEKKR